MQPDQTPDDVLIRYLLGEGSPEDEGYVAAWVNEDAENRLHLEQLAHTLKLVAIGNDSRRINLAEEWVHLETMMKRESVVSIHHSPTMQSEQVDETPPRAGSKVLRILFAGLVAASLLIAVAYGLGFFDDNNDARDTIAHKDSVSSGNIDSLMAVKVYLENTTAKNKILSLPDGSDITLYPNSQLTYQVPSANDRRDVLLKGKAQFKVAKDGKRPFAVRTTNLSTVAVGTDFLVTENLFAKQIVVQLFEGKVSISASRTAYSNALQQVFLLPGQELDYNMAAGTAVIRNFGKGKPQKKDTNTGFINNDSPSIPDFDNRSWFMFNNQSLPQIFDALGDMYDVDISYSKKEISKMYFIGSFDRSDSVEYILKQIAFINNLEVIRTNKMYRVTKKRTVQK